MFIYKKVIWNKNGMCNLWNIDKRLLSKSLLPRLWFCYTDSTLANAYKLNGG